VLGAVFSRRRADHQQNRPPFGNQPPDLRKAGAAFSRGDGGERMGKPCFEVANGNAGALRAEVESQDRAGPGERGGERGIQVPAWKLAGDRN
jgi:hypothetical protein